MELEAIEDVVRERGAEDGADAGLRLLLAKLGQLAQSELESDAMLVSDETHEKEVANALASILMLSVHAAVEKDIDIEEAVEQRIEYLEEAAEKRESLEESVEAIDIESVAAEMFDDVDVDDDDAEDADTITFQ